MHSGRLILAAFWGGRVNDIICNKFGAKKSAGMPALFDVL